MKNLVLVLAFLFGAQAQASFYQVTCSSSDAGVMEANGHVKNHLTVMKRTWDKGVLTEEAIEIDRSAVDVEYSNEVEVAAESTSSCTEAGKGGVSQWKNVTAKKITITAPDGETFDKHMAGVTIDGTQIEAYMICNFEGNSMVICN